MRYIYAPLDLTDEQSHIYKLLYQRCDFKTMIVKYTKEQLLIDSNPIFKLTERKIRTILEYFLKEEFIQEIEKGKKGHPTIYEIITIKKIMFERQTNVSNVTDKRQTNVSNDVVIPTVTEVERQTSDKQTSDKRQTNVRPINDKEKDKEKYIDIYNYYLSLDIVKHSTFTPAMSKAIELAIKQNKYSVEDCKELLRKHKEVIVKSKSSQYPIKKRPLVEFFGQKIKDSTALICTQYEIGGKYDFIIDEVKVNDPNKKVITRRENM